MQTNIGMSLVRLQGVEMKKNMNRKKQNTFEYGVFRDAKVNPKWGLCGSRRLLGQFSHLSIMDLFPLGQLRGKKLGHDVLKQNCGVVLPVFKELGREK